VNYVDEQLHMGLFLSASGILSPDNSAVRDAISSFVTSTGGPFELRAGTTDDSNIGVMQSTASSTTVLYPAGFGDWDDLSKFLSAELETPVFSFHIHDGDLWMFVAFHKGKEVAWFNPLPDYWGEIDDSERARWSGNANSVASLVPGLDAASVDRYLVPWTEEVTASEQKAYDDDEFPIGVDWQLTDFMRRLGFCYPLDQSGMPTGETFYLKIRRQRPSFGANAIPTSEARTQSAKQQPKRPWWKIW
jgi:hypothetical protein